MEVLERMARINGSKLPPGTLKIETQVHILQEVSWLYPTCFDTDDIASFSFTYVFHSICFQTVERVKIQVLFNSEYRLTTLLLWLNLWVNHFLFTCCQCLTSPLWISLKERPIKHFTSKINFIHFWSFFSSDSFTSGFLYYGVVLMSAQVLQQVRPDESICDLGLFLKCEDQDRES